MRKFRLSALSFSAVYIAAYYAWVVLFEDHFLLRVLGGHALPIAAALIGAAYQFRAFRSASGPHRRFWLLLGIGLTLNASTYAYGLYYHLRTGAPPAYPSPIDAMWIGCYTVYLVALVSQIVSLGRSVPVVPHLYNILIFVTAAVAIAANFLITPIFGQPSGSWRVTALALAYPIFDVAMFASAVTLSYLSQRSAMGRLYFLIAAAFFVQTFMDGTYAYLSMAGTYLIGSWLDPLWLIPVFTIGFVGREAVAAERQASNVVWEAKNLHIVPYLGFAVLLGFVIYDFHDHMNSLTYGITITTIAMLFRQIYILKENARVVREYKHLAYHDPLTGLRNRAMFRKNVEGLIEAGKRDGRTSALMLIDLDRFKVVNDTLGHYIGDCLLKETAERLRRCAKDGAEVYRIGGDEFVVIAPESSCAEAARTAESILREMQAGFSLSGHEVSVTPSIGICLFPEDGETAEQLLIRADSAMYYAKERGKNNYQFYNAMLSERVLRKMELEKGLRKALRRDEFELFYQPKVDLPSKRIVGMEALLRWRHPRLGLVSPAEFIPVAEETGEIVAIGEWVLRTACAQNRRWQEAGYPPLCVSVNVSVRQFQEDSFEDTVRHALETTGLEPRYLDLEITESVIQNVKESERILGRLKAMGIGISLDDFGVGYSSLHVLKKLPIDTIKIDKSFIDDCLTDATSMSIVDTIIRLGTELRLNVVVEGIESEQQAEALYRKQCRIGQGYAFGRPTSAREFETLLAAKRDERRLNAPLSRRGESGDGVHHFRVARNGSVRYTE